MTKIRFFQKSPKKYSNTPMNEQVEFVVVGLNSIGRTLAGLLSVSELGSVTLIDDKKVSAKCVTSGYLEIDVGQYRTDATADAIREINPKAKISKKMRLDDDALDSLASKINGNTVLLCCDNMSPKARQHLYTEMQNCCQAIYFFGFDDTEGSGQVVRLTTGGYNADKAIEKIPAGRELPVEGKRLAAKAFAMQVSADQAAEAS